MQIIIVACIEAEQYGFENVEVFLMSPFISVFIAKIPILIFWSHKVELDSSRVKFV